jgi:hypothetical protein
VFATVNGRWALAVAVAVAAVLCASCGGDDDTASSTSPTNAVETTDVETSDVPGARCIVRLHGKSGTGADTVVEGGVSYIAPSGNAEGWGGRQWLYFPDADYEAARAIVADAVASCEQIIIDGFSNGASFAAKLYCRGETFDGRLLGIVIDDPVVDEAVEGCEPNPDVKVALYWTGALEAQAQPGWDCAEADWTCEGGVTIGIDAYADALGTAVLASPFTDHQWYLDAPELSSWWAR